MFFEGVAIKGGRKVCTGLVRVVVRVERDSALTQSL